MGAFFTKAPTDEDLFSNRSRIAFKDSLNQLLLRFDNERKLTYLPPKAAKVKIEHIVCHKWSPNAVSAASAPFHRPKG